MKAKLDQLKKKQGNSLAQRDLADEVYENKHKINKQKFCNKIEGDENYTDLFTSVLVVVNKKKEQDFLDNYHKFLITHNANDFVAWEKRTL